MLSAEENLAECYRYAIDWNCIVFSVDYRKGPETKCPNQQKDFAEAVKFIHSSALKENEEINKNPEAEHPI